MEPTAWSELVLGRLRASHRETRDGRTVLVLCPCAPPCAPLLTNRQLRIIERLASGASYGEIGFDLGLELSTVATHVARSLAVLGLGRLELPMLVIGAPLVSRSPKRELVIPYPRVDGTLVPELSSAERDVVRRLLVGASNRRIALDRGTSERTVANQLRTLFKKLGVCSRIELAALIAVRSASGRSAAASRPVIALA